MLEEINKVALRSMLVASFYYFGKAFNYDIFYGLISEYQVNTFSFVVALWLLIMQGRLTAIPVIVLMGILIYPSE